MKDHPRNTKSKDVFIWGYEKRHNCILDRRSGFDRRQMYSLTYFINGGHERRWGLDRRHSEERRRLWEMRGFPCSGISA